MIRVLACLVLLASPALAQTAPGDAANAFYAVYKSQQPHGGGIPDATGRLRWQAVLSPRLNKLIADAAASQARLTAKVKGAVPPMLEGDIFTSLFDGATGWKVGACNGDAKVQRCAVALTHAPPPLPGYKTPDPTNWTDTVVLVPVATGWKVDEVIYDPALRDGNTGRLSAMLQMVVSQNP